MINPPINNLTVNKLTKSGGADIIFFTVKKL